MQQRKAFVPFVVSILLLAPLAASAAPPPQVVGPEVGQASHHDVSPPLRDIVPPTPLAPPPDREVNPIEPPNRQGGSNVQGPPDPGRQTVERPLQAAPLTALPIFDFEGLSDDDNAAAGQPRIVPPDTEGDVGPNHYVQWINLIFGVWDITRDANGNPTSVTFDAGFGIRPGNTLWAGFGNGVPGSPSESCENNNDGDPIVLYDHLADRWFLSQFSIDEGVQCVAVSTGPDPTGSYFRWAFEVSPGEANDYPKFGLMPDAYYLSLRDFPSNDGTFASAVAFDRAALLAGSASVTFVKFSLPCLANNCPDAIQPPHLEGPAPPSATPGFFTRAWDDNFDGPLTGADGYRIWEFVADFVTPANSSFTELPFIVGTPYDSNMCGFFNRNCIPQASSAQLLDSVDELQMYRAQYRHFAGSHDSIVLNTTVDATGTDVAGIRWAELRNTGAGWTLFQDGTYAPEDGIERWMGSAAMDSQGNIALGFSASSSLIDPSIRYTSRAATDPPGTMTGGEVEMQIGLGAQTQANRWGDYSTMSVDPVADCTFWYTNEYYANTGGFDFKTRIGAFQVSTCDTGCTSNAECDDGLFCNGAETCDLGTGTCQPGTDPCAPLACDEVNDVCIGGGSPQLESACLTVGATPANVGLTNTYASPVVVTTVQYNNNTTPVVTRVSGVTSTGFSVRLQNPSGGAVAAENVCYLVVEEGAWTIDGVNVEAQKYTSTVTSEAPGGWVGEPQSYLQSYTNPVVLGQVMSENDPGFSVFWEQGSALTNPPSASALSTGKTVCEDTDVTRADEEVGFVVFEAGHGTLGGVEFEAALGADTVLGVTNAPPYAYTFSIPFGAAPTVANVQMAGVDGNNGGWAQVHGPTLATSTSLFLSIDEDQIVDTERNHTNEQVSYVVFGGPVVFPPAATDPVAEWGCVTAGATAARVNLTQTYTSPVVVTAVQYANNTIPVVPRISNLSGSGFGISLQNAGAGTVVADDVCYLVVEEGVHTVNGVTIEARSYTSTVTDGNNSWVGQAQSLAASFTNPVVLGQVMSSNDPDWSVFWDQGTARTNPPIATALTTGKTVCEDTLTARADETVGFVVIEAGHGTLGGVEFEAALGADTIQGIGNAPPYTYTFSSAFGSTPSVAVVTQAGMDGGNGGWAYVFGANPLSATTLDLAIDEDTIGDTERVHINEQVGYVVFATAGSVSQ